MLGGISGFGAASGIGAVAGGSVGFCAGNSISAKAQKRQID